MLLARLLVPEDFGKIAVARLVIDYLDTFITQGLGLAIIQRQDLTRKHLNSAFWANMLVSCLLASLLYLLAPTVARFFHSPPVTPLLQCLAVTLIISGLSRTQAALLTKEMKFKQLSLRSLLMATIGGITGISLALLGYGVWSLAWQQVVASLVGLAVLWKVSSWRPGFAFSRSAFLELFRFGKNVFFDQQIKFFSTRIDEAVIAVLLGTTQLGYYSIAKRLLTTLNTLLTHVLDRVLFSAISRLQYDRPLVNRLTTIATYLLSGVAFPLFFICIALSGPMIIVLFGEQWIKADRVFQILMLCGPFLFVPALLHVSFLSVGRSEIPLISNLIRSGVGIGFIYFGSFFGLVGIAVAVLIKDVLGAILDLIFAKKLLKLNVFDYSRNFFSFLPVSSLMLFAVYLLSSALRSTGWSMNLEFFVSLAFGALFYLSLLFFFHKKKILSQYAFLSRRE